MKLAELSESIKGKSVKDQLMILGQQFTGRVVFTTSFSMEDQVITHLIFSNDIPINIVTIDTGRLFPETYKVFSATREKYNRDIKVYFPSAGEVENMVSSRGPYSFYNSREERLECCRIRKVEPLNRALEGMKVWISGIRAEQSENRSKMNSLEWDEKRQMFKFSPLFDWSSGDVTGFTAENNIPVNILHSRGYPSIGCEPCTRPVNEGEDPRAGRWWWENGGKKECGLHLPAPGK